jgi:hypothetical protein
MRTPLILPAAGALMLLAACAPTPDPESSDPVAPEPNAGTPGLITEVEGTSDLEDDPFVIAARAEDTGFLMAVNALDFSIPEFTETHSADGAWEIYQFFIDENVIGANPVIMFAGPAILLPLDVNVNESGDGAEVLFCDASVDWTISKEFPEPAYDLTAGQELTITLVTDDRGNLVFESEDRGGADCDATGAPVQRFDPAPVPPDSLSPDDVIPPPE